MKVQFFFHRIVTRLLVFVKFKRFRAFIDIFPKIKNIHIFSHLNFSEGNISLLKNDFSFEL